MRVEGNAVRIAQGPGWVFGDVALLFNSPRTASVVAATDVVLWALDRVTFLRFVMKHAQGAHTLRFVRKVRVQPAAIVHVSACPSLVQALLRDWLSAGTLARRKPSEILVGGITFAFDCYSRMVSRLRAGHCCCAVLCAGAPAEGSLRQ
jgi:hypothetical protein